MFNNINVEIMLDALYTLSADEFISEFIENSVHGVPKKSKLPESSTTHHETSVYKKQSTTPISEAPFETLSESDIPVDPGKTFQTDTLEYIDDSLSPSPEYILKLIL